MTEQRKLRTRLTGGAAILALIIAGACSPRQSSRAPVDIKGSNPDRTATAPAAPVATDGTGIVSSGADRYVVAQAGDTVTTLAARNGLSASELGAYNGLQPTQPLRAGDELVLPPGPAGSPETPVPAAPAATTALETTPLPPSGGVPVAADGTIPAEAGAAVPGGTTIAAGEAVPGTAPTGAPAPTAPPTGWSPDIAAAAIERSTGLNEDGSLGAPPSSTDPVPGEPTAPRDLASPKLDQYQTGASAGDGVPLPRPDAGTDVATAAPATPRRQDAPPAMRLLRPVEGPIAVGFGEGAGPAKNDGVDFAAPAGARVVAAADGEVALVSESLGGLGTIVLVRHANEILTVYGRIAEVTVQKGDVVTRGQQIGVVSNAAAPAEPRMHFEVRRGATVMDPMRFL